MTARMLRIDQTYPDQMPAVTCHRCGSPGGLVFNRASGVFECRVACLRWARRKTLRRAAA